MNQKPENTLVARVESMGKRAREAKLTSTQESVVEIEDLDDDYFMAGRPCSSIKCDIQTLEHPFYSLSKKKDTEQRVFEYNITEKGKRKTISIKIIPSVIGRATIYDKDILTYCASLLSQAYNRGEEISRRVRFTANRYLLDTKRVKKQKDVGSSYYKALEMQLLRLKGTTIYTNVPSNGKTYTDAISLIDNFCIVRDEKTKKMESIEVVLSKYFYEAVINKQILTQTPEYFEIKNPFTKRLYEIARKHCGKQSTQIGFRYDQLYNKTGSTASFSEFMRMCRKAIMDNAIPDYSFIENKDEKRFYFFRKDLEQNTKAA